MLRRNKASMVLTEVLILFFLRKSFGSEKCQQDAECSLGTFCSNGFCEGDCVKCRIFLREESANGCAKELKNCGPCLSGTEAEELVTGGQSIYCKPIGIGHSSPPAFETSANSWLVWALTAIIVIVIAAAAAGAIRRKKRRRDIKKSTSTDPPFRGINEEVELVQYSDDNPPSNPYFGNSETTNHVGAQPINVHDYVSEGESDDSTDAPPSNRLLPPHETVNNNANLGIYQDVEIDLSEFRISESFTSIEASSGAQFSSVSIDSDDNDEDSVGFSIVVKSVGSPNSTNKA